MGPFLAGTSSISTNVQSFSQVTQSSSVLPALAPSFKVSLARRRARGLTCKSGTEAGGGTTETNEASTTTSEQATPNPFASGKISSRVKVKKPVETETEPETEITSPFSTSALPPTPPEISSPFSASALPFETRVPSPFEKKEEVKSPSSESSGSSSGKISSRVKVRSGDASSASKAFKAPPTIASPFDTNPVPKDPTMNKRGITMIPEMDERVLESRKQILKELYSERKTDSRMNAAPADIFDEPKALSPEEDNFKFDLIKGAEPYFLVISFSLITALMFGTAFAAYKLGAFHYNEL